MLKRWCTSAFLYGSGEILCDKISKRDPDTARTTRTVVFGATGDAICLRAFHKVVDTHIKFPFVRMLSEQLLYSPFSNMSYLTIVKQGFDWNLSEFVTVYKNDCMYWPFVSYIGYKFVPFHIRYAYVSTASLVWNTWRSGLVRN